MSQSFEQIFGYNPIEEYKGTPAWRKERRAGLSPLVDAQIGYMGQMETNKANAQLAQAQNDFNLEMWNKQNEYNSPKATMERLVDAGINPRAYQQIGTFANASQPHAAERPDYDSPLGKLARFTDKANVDLTRKGLMLQKIQLGTDITNALADKIIAKKNLDFQRSKLAQYIGLEDRKLEHQISYDTQLMQIANSKAIIDEDKFRIALKTAGITYDPETRSFDIPEGNIRLKEKQIEAIISNLKAAAANKLQGIDLMKLEEDLRKVNTGNKVADTFLKFLTNLLID